MDTATYQVKKKAAGGFSVCYDCPHCATALTWPLTDAGTSKPCTTCTKPSVVPGKANLEWLKAKQDADRRKAEQARQQELQQAEEAKQKQQAEADRARVVVWDDEEVDEAAEEDRIEAFWKTHCRYCYEEIKENAKKCKNCCEFIDEELRAKATEQVVARFRPPLGDVFWLAVKFWGVTLLFAGAGYVLYLIAGYAVASVR